MKLTLIDERSGISGCPSLYRTDRGTFVVQGWKVTDPEVLCQMAIPDHESCVEVPAELLPFLQAKH